MVHTSCIPMRINVICCHLTHFLKGHLALFFQESLQRLITRDKELIPQDKVFQTLLSLLKTCRMAPLLQIPPKSINKLLRSFTILMLKVSSLHKSESLQEILFESFVTPYIVIRQALINIQGLTV